MSATTETATQAGQNKPAAYTAVDPAESQSRREHQKVEDENHGNGQSRAAETEKGDAWPGSQIAQHCLRRAGSAAIDVGDAQFPCFHR